MSAKTVAWAILEVISFVTISVGADDADNARLYPRADTQSVSKAPTKINPTASSLPSNCRPHAAPTRPNLRRTPPGQIRPLAGGAAILVGRWRCTSEPRFAASSTPLRWAQHRNADPSRTQHHNHSRRAAPEGAAAAPGRAPHGRGARLPPVEPQASPTLARHRGRGPAAQAAKPRLVHSTGKASQPHAAVC